MPHHGDDFHPSMTPNSMMFPSFRLEADIDDDIGSDDGDLPKAPTTVVAMIANPILLVVP